MTWKLQARPYCHGYVARRLRSPQRTQPSSSSSSINLSGSKRFVSKSTLLVLSRKTCYRLLQAKRTTSCFTWPISSEFYSDAPEVLLECVASSAARSNKEILRTLEHGLYSTRKVPGKALETKIKAWVIPWQGVV